MSLFPSAAAAMLPLLTEAVPYTTPSATVSSMPECPDMPPPPPPAPYLASEVVVAAVAVAGNALTIAVFAKHRRLRRLTNYYIVSLAAADLLVGVLGIPCAILTSLGRPVAMRQPCLLMLCTLVLLCTCSIFSLVGVSVDRYWAILYPLPYARLMTRSRARRIILLCWVLGAIVGLLPMFGWHLECRLCLFVSVMKPSYLVFLYFATIVGPGLLMAFFYAHIFSVVIKQLRQIDQQGPPPPPQQEPVVYCIAADGVSSGRAGADGGRGSRTIKIRGLSAPSTLVYTSRREVKAAKQLSIIVLFFMVCWFPLYTINCITAFCPTCRVPAQLLDLTIILSHANSAVNPLLYAYHMKDFRYALKELIWRRPFGGKRRRRDGSPTVPALALSIGTTAHKPVV